MPFRKGTQVLSSPYLVQRQRAFFPNPEHFWPERWTDELTKTLPKFAYFPFGGGQRMCIGLGFAMMEIQIALATILSHVRFELTHQTPEQVVGRALPFVLAVVCTFGFTVSPCTT